MMRSKCSSRKVIFACVLSAFLMNEYLVYWIQPCRWPAFPDISRDLDKNIVILFVADPQILGYQNEPHYLGYVTRWDSDRYLRKSFELVWEYTKPDVVVFLGDLFDEGSDATHSDYKATIERFTSIFPVIRDPVKQTILIAGDNDVGGEGIDRRSNLKVSRFEKYFQNLTGMKSMEFVDFLKLDIMQNGEQDMTAAEMADILANHTTQPFRILLNHEKVVRDDKLPIHEILRRLQPQLIVSAHWHKSKYFFCEKCLSEDIEPEQWQVEKTNLLADGAFIELKLQSNGDIREIMVPTCSYRMGVNKMGYGLAILENTGKLKYTVLWQLDRELILKSYLVWLSLIAFITLRIFLQKCLSSTKSSRFIKCTHFNWIFTKWFPRRKGELHSYIKT